ncbi:hypothetical protein ZIOFF_035343 [Zingiber officinale]|uniref:Transmembrane protein n=1 Tax=Zingiber officinale TaxID=94328 RepID=A0A8J5GEI4_ZINOF|nr:hypothetical protein ZIOFF_035343 [Zingiber officinale]
MEEPLLSDPVSNHAPLLPDTNFNVATPPSRSTSSPNLVVLTIFILVVTFSFWANYEVSKSFDINALHAMPTPLLVVTSTSSSLITALVHRVTVSMDTNGGLNDTVVVICAGVAENEFEVLMNPTVMEAADV